MEQTPEKDVSESVLQRSHSTSDWNRLQGILGDVQVVFTDYEALPAYSRAQQNENVSKHRRKRRKKGVKQQQVDYWNDTHWQVPHVLFVKPEFMPLQPPPGWSIVHLLLDHTHLGGSTTSRWVLIALLPPSHRACRPYSLPAQPWQPMHTRINQMIGGLDTTPPIPSPSDGQPQVNVDEVTGGVISTGLFPHDNLPAKVIAPDDRSKTGFVLRLLTWQEKAGLWDVPIRMVDEAGKREEFVPIIESIFTTPPAKFLELGVDALLADVFRGGYKEVKNNKKRMGKDKESCATGQKRRKVVDGSWASVEDMDGGRISESPITELDFNTAESQRPTASLQIPHRTTPLAEMLDKNPTATHKKVEVNAPDSALPTRWLRSPQELLDFDSKNEGKPTELPRPVEDTTHLFCSHSAKQDEQKADGAAVPEQLWSNALEETFESKVGRPLPEGWQKSMNGFRQLGIRRWRLQLLRTYLRWRRANYPLMMGSDTRQIYTPSNQRGLVTKGWEEGKGYVFAWTAKGRSAYAKDHARIRNTEAGEATIKVALDAIIRAAGPYTRDHILYLSTWWEWVSGSAPFFWNWPERYQSEIRDGQRHFLLGKFHYFNKGQRGPKDEKDGPLIREKVTGVRKKGYIEMGTVLSLIHYFYVPKGKEDIRMVYNGTSCGLNDMLWAPHFGLPFVKHTVRSLMPGYLQCDMDIGEMFLNFMLHKDLRALSGVDLKHARSEDVKDEAWERTRPGPFERWCRNWMGLRDSPYRSIQQLIRLKMDAYGDSRDRTNPFHWEKVVLNLPGSEDYRPDLPWVMKVRFDGHLACEVFVYVDDGRITGFCREICWAAARRMASVCTKRGVQDSSRKRTGPSTTPGPWAGTMCFTNDDRVAGLVSQTKWDKTRALVLELKEMVEVALAKEGGKSMPRQRLLEIRGYLNYIVRTYGWLNPYMKGLHNTIDGWRDNRDEGGWKLTVRELRERAARQQADVMLGRREMDRHLEGECLVPSPEGTSEPDLVAPVERLIQDVKALEELTNTLEPPKVDYRGREGLTAWYCPGDASGKGFGTALVMNGEGVLYESGMWTKKYAEESSNFREADNLVIRLEKEVRKKDMRGREIFVFTDNAVFESTYYKGYSQSKKLSDIAFRLHKLQREAGLILHVIHIAGTRMKDWGVDGLSRGDLLDGMMKGKDPLSFIPLNKGANERSDGAVKEWILGWWNGVWPDALTELTPQMWFELRDVQGPRL
jgi:hypothetical protein